MSLSATAGPRVPQRVAGGFALIPVRQLMCVWHHCRTRPLGVGDFRSWLACREMVARRCALRDGQAPDYSAPELARLTGVSPRRARASVRRLVGAGLLTWADAHIGFPAADTGAEPSSPAESLADTIGGGRGDLIVPRRVLRFLAGGARPALIATALAALLRCLSRGRGGFKARGRLKASWVARAFGVDLRRVKQARQDLVALGWLTPEATDSWAENRWGRVYRVDLDWAAPAAGPRGARLPPPSAAGGAPLPPPDLLHQEPLTGLKNQEPVSDGPPGVCTHRHGEGQPTWQTPTATLAPAAPQPSAPGGQRTVPCRSGTTKTGPVASPAAVDPRLPTAVRIEGPPLPAPRLGDVRAEDLKDTGRLLALLGQAIGRGLVGPGEADRLKFVAAAEHARSVGTRNPCGLFARLARRGWWHFATQSDEDAASARLKSHLFGGRRDVGTVPRPEFAAAPRLSADAEVVSAVRAACIRAGVFRDPFQAFRERHPNWTRQRWDVALAEAQAARPAV